VRIAIDASFHLGAGGLNHLDHLLRSWDASGSDRVKDVHLFVRTEDVKLLDASATAKLQLHEVGGPLFRLPVKIAWEQTVLPRLVKSIGADVVFCPGNMAPLRVSIPSVVAFQNALPFCGLPPDVIGRYEWVWARTLAAMMRRSARASTRIIFVSNYLRDLFVASYGVPIERTAVVYYGRGPLGEADGNAPGLARLGIRPPYLLSVSHLYPYKNFTAVIDAYARRRERFVEQGVQLVLAGRPRSQSYGEELRRTVERLGVSDWVLMPGPVPRDSVGALLAGCLGYVFQSRCEANPNALIEALVAGVPIACSRAGPMPEIAEEGAVYFDPLDPEDIGAALERITTDEKLRSELAARARERAERLPTWDEVAEQTLVVLEDAARAG
jgi:glycosyltransferase involved in cell wall biosynthesis